MNYTMIASYAIRVMGVYYTSFLLEYTLIVLWRHYVGSGYCTDIGNI